MFYADEDGNECEAELEGMFENYLNEIYGDIDICGLTYAAADALKRVDPIAYRCAYSDYTSEFEERF